MSDVTPAEKAAEALDDAIQYIERNQCSHEDTYRAGTIWTICSACGQKWADDEGGFQPAETPQVVVRAREALDALRPPPADAQIPVGVRQLEWREARISGRWERYSADTLFGSYEALEYSDGSFGGTLADRSEFSARSIEDAKAIAQADYERHILSAIATAPANAQTPVGVEAVAWRVRFVWLNSRQQYERTNWRYERTREDAEELAAEADDDQGSEMEPLFSAADMARVMGERDEARRYAHEATKAITGLTCGGSEFFGKKLGEIYTADLARCVQHIRERRENFQKRSHDAYARISVVEAALSASEARAEAAEKERDEWEAACMEARFGCNQRSDTIRSLLAAREAAEKEAAALREVLIKSEDAISEYYRYQTGGETRGSYDGKPERNGLWQAMYTARAALTQGGTDGR